MVIADAPGSPAKLLPDSKLPYAVFFNFVVFGISQSGGGIRGWIAYNLYVYAGTPASQATFDAGAVVVGSGVSNF
jgi:hypothetical protein